MAKKRRRKSPDVSSDYRKGTRDAKRLLGDTPAMAGFIGSDASYEWIWDELGVAEMPDDYRKGVLSIVNQPTDVLVEAAKGYPAAEPKQHSQAHEAAVGAAEREAGPSTMGGIKTDDPIGGAISGVNAQIVADRSELPGRSAVMPMTNGDGVTPLTDQERQTQAQLESSRRYTSSRGGG